MLILGAGSAPLAIALVFFRLIVRPKLKLALEKPSMRRCNCSRECATRVASSSAESMSLTRTSRALVFALRRDKLNSLPSGLVWRFPRSMSQRPVSASLQSICRIVLERARTPISRHYRWERPQTTSRQTG